MNRRYLVTAFALTMLAGCASDPAPIDVGRPPILLPASEPTPILDGVTVEEVKAAALACGYPHVPDSTLDACMTLQGFRIDGNVVSRASPERLAAERAEFERAYMMLQLTRPQYNLFGGL